MPDPRRIAPSIRVTILAPPALLACVLVASACAGDPADDLVVRRDSAGVAIVESSAPRLESVHAWRVDTAPLLDLTLTGEGDAHIFHGVADALRMADGSLVVADAGSHQVRRYAADGTLQWRVGRDGEGPGEFRQLANVARFRGDSVIAFDYWLGRATVIGPDGGVGRAFHPYGPKPAVERLLALDDTLLVAQVSAYARMEGNAGLFRIPAHVVTISAAGAVTDTVTEMHGIETFLLERGDMRPLFPRTGRIATGHGRVHVGDAERMEIEVWSPEGRVERIVRVPAYDLAISPRELERERALMLGARPSSRARELVAALPDPATRPAYAQLVVDATGAVWAAGFRALADTIGPTAWELFDADGTWLGATELPRTLRVLEIGEDWVLAVHPDEMDVERVQLLPLRRGTP
jgi:hypothetical protein